MTETTIQIGNHSYIDSTAKITGTVTLGQNCSIWPTAVIRGDVNFITIDEAASLAPALDVAIRHELDLFYVANGQRVPEDLHLPNRAYLLHRALNELPDDTPHQLSGDEAGLLLAARRNAGAASLRGEVQHG